MESKTDSGTRASQALAEICGILLKKGLVESPEEYTAPMLEDLVHYAYFTGCVNRGDIQRLLNLTREETRRRIQAWKRWQDGNRSCQIRQNPFYEDWIAEPEDPDSEVS
jgi:hypothetical protein